LPIACCFHFGTPFAKGVAVKHSIHKKMNEHKLKYHALRQQAVEMMQAGNINAYLAKLLALSDVRMQLINSTAAR